MMVRFLMHFFVNGWEKDDDGNYTPMIGMLGQIYHDKHGGRHHCIYGQYPKPDDIHTMKK